MPITAAAIAASLSPCLPSGAMERMREARKIAAMVPFGPEMT